MNSNFLNEFCRDWLAAWTGNNPEKLISFYAPDIFYKDPAVAKGIRGCEALLAYLKKLLAKNPDWVWQPLEILPTEPGFVLKWQAEIPANGHVITVEGLDIVELREQKISRNEVYFDRSLLLHPTQVNPSSAK
ncbi:hypothetical protein AQUSIP_07990 [Aquicella siphonis]|uniref:SnoaL-like domain-containing protein n=1 Tax=Aquicella siphonis TaxID=254247 RepID=A0A5E4PEU6_9COXI|nr:nuclear transport factor 2 family protein [Aquicella siphonis]VVC75509.1 hypothetical protein AQUSIP_07990 [Aquicella siphonis]